MELLKVRDVCRILKISRATLCKLYQSGKLPYVRVGSTAVRFKMREVERYIDRRTRAKG